MCINQTHTQPFKEGCYVQNSFVILMINHNFFKTLEPGLNFATLYRIMLSPYYLEMSILPCPLLTWKPIL
jgi:hypothetical protein